MKYQLENKIIIIKYHELKKAYLDVIKFTHERTSNWFKKSELNRSTKIEDNLGFVGLDNEQFLIEFSDEFEVDFSKMDYEKFFTSESELMNPKITLFFPFLIVFYIAKFLFGILTYPFSKSSSRKIKEYDLPVIEKSIKIDVTLGDLTTSLLMKRFYERKKVTFKFNLSEFK